MAIVVSKETAQKIKDSRDKAKLKQAFIMVKKMVKYLKNDSFNKCKNLTDVVILDEEGTC